MLLEPRRGERNDLIQRAWLLEQMRCTWNEFQARGASKLTNGAPVQFDNEGVALADNQKRRRLHVGEGVGGKVRPATARDDRPDQERPPRRCGKRCCSTRARPKQAYVEIGRGVLFLNPVERLFQPPREERNVKDFVTIVG